MPEEFIGDYIALETYRRDGTPVATPVWFVEDSGLLYIRTLEGSGKVKRLDQNSRVRAAPSSFAGEPSGTWVGGTADLVSGEEEAKTIDRLFRKKYGIQTVVTGVLSRVRGRRYVIYRLRLG